MRSPEGFAVILAALIKSDHQEMYLNIDCLSKQELETLDRAALQLSQVCQTQLAMQRDDPARKAKL